MWNIKQRLMESLKRVLNAADKYSDANEEKQIDLPRDTAEFSEWENAYKEARALLSELNNNITVAHK